MTITKAEILTALNLRLNREETDVDTYIRATVYDISVQYNFLEKEDSSISTVDGTPNYDLPNSDQVKNIKNVVVEKDSSRSFPLGFMTWQDYLVEREGTAVTGEPEEYTIFDNDIYLYPTPDDVYTVYMYINRIHPTDLSTILFNEVLREALILYTIKKYLEGKEDYKAAQYWESQFYIEISKQSTALGSRKPIGRIKYNDI